MKPSALGRFADCTRRAAGVGVALLTALLAGALLAGVGQGIPSSTRLQIVHGAPSLTDQEVRRMQEAWTTLKETSGVSHFVIRSGGLDRTDGMSESEAARLRSLRRMLLYSTEADEMQIPLSLSLMKPFSFDFNPRFFMYGGFLIYGCGLMIGLAGLLGFLPLSGGLDAFLRHPDQMGVLYMAARLWPLVLTSLLPFFSYRIARSMMPRRQSLLVAFLTLLPPGVYYYGAVLKPSAPAAVLALLAVHCAITAAVKGRRRDFAATGIALGMAGATFPTQFIAGAGMLMAALLVARRDWRRGLEGIVVCAIVTGGVFLLANPYWILDTANVIREIRFVMGILTPDPSVATMAEILTGVVPAVTSTPIMVGGCLAIIAAFLRRQPPLLVLATTAIAVLSYYAWRISGGGLMEPSRFARYFIMLGPLWIILMAGVVAQAPMRLRTVGMTVLVMVSLTALPSSILAVRNNWGEASLESTRYRAGRWLESTFPQGTPIHVVWTPAPYTTPFFRLDRYPALSVTSADSVPVGAVIVTVSEMLETEARDLLRDCEMIREFPSHRTLAGIGPFPETITYANARVRFWRRISGPAGHQERSGDLP